MKSITKSVSTLFELKKWNYQFIAKYLILVSLTATVLIFNPFNNYIDSNSQLTPPVVENENIQVVLILYYSIELISQIDHFSVIFLNYHWIIMI